MKKKALLRGLTGFPFGIFIGYTITILISLVHSDGSYAPVVPALVEQLGSEIRAVVLQYSLCGVYGIIWAASSVIWENDNWSILKQTIVHFLIVSLSTLPIAYFAHWMEHTLAGIASYFGIFIGIYVVIWAVIYGVWSHKIKQVNDKIKEENK